MYYIRLLTVYKSLAKPALATQYYSFWIPGICRFKLDIRRVLCCLPSPVFSYMYKNKIQMVSWKNSTNSEQIKYIKKWQNDIILSLLLNNILNDASEKFVNVNTFSVMKVELHPLQWPKSLKGSSVFYWETPNDVLHNSALTCLSTAMSYVHVTQSIYVYLVFSHP